MKYRVKYSLEMGGYIPQFRYKYLPIWFMVSHYTYPNAEQAEHIINLVKFKKEL